uniref:Ig-like domain-containing protein n=1 Tax=Poecilia latipinna TaxID=48699 RepID=A0A3B3TG26_9TELE
MTANVFILHFFYMLVPVKTVALGEPATFTCQFPGNKLSNNEVQWYKQTTGDTLALIVKLRKHADPAFGQEFSSSRMTASKNETVSRLTILRTVPEDEGMYHCATIDWAENEWQGTYLYLKGNRTSKHTIVQQLTAADSHLPGDSVTLQCSVLSNSDKMCPEDLSVFWFRARSHNSHPHIIYVDGNKHDDCNKRNDSQRRCAFSKNISSTDNGTYYCAVATCGEIFIGNGTKAKVQGNCIVLMYDNFLFYDVVCCCTKSGSLTERETDMNGKLISVGEKKGGNTGH